MPSKTGSTLSQTKKLKAGKIRRRVCYLFVYFFLICISFIYLLPLIKMISMMFMTQEDIVDSAVTWLPRTLSLNNIRVAVNVLNMWKSLGNSIWFSSLLAVCQTIVSSMAGYALARFRFKLKKVCFALMIMSFILPLPILLVPRMMIFTTMQSLLTVWAGHPVQVIGTVWPQILISLFGQGVYSSILILIFYNFFRMIPYSLDEAAMIDGASVRQVFSRIILPLSSSTIFVVFLFSFVWNWNETYQTSTFLRSGLELLPMKLSLFDTNFSRVMGSSGEGSKAQYRLNEAYQMTATFLSILPILILYIFVQKRFIKGIENTGITGE